MPCFPMYVYRLDRWHNYPSRHHSVKQLRCWCKRRSVANTRVVRVTPRPRHHLERHALPASKQCHWSINARLQSLTIHPSSVRVCLGGGRGSLYTTARLPDPLSDRLLGLYAVNFQVIKSTQVESPSSLQTDRASWAQPCSLWKPNASD